MRPALREAYIAVQRVLKENEYIPVRKIKYFPNGSIREIEFTGLTREIEKKVEDAVWEVKIARDEKGLDEQSRVVGFSCSAPLPDLLSNSGYLSLS
jgi:predicted transcriptional regulator